MAVATSWAMAELLLIAIALFFFFLTRSPSNSQLQLPPSPLFIPLLGHIHLLLLPRAFRRSVLLKLGPVFTLHLGRFPIIFVTSASAAHEALISKSPIFSTRPRFPSQALFTSNFRNINASSYGPYWRSMRRNLVQEMLGSGKLQAFKPARTRIISLMLSPLRELARKDDGVVAVYSTCRIAILQLLLFMCFGIHMEDNAVLEVSDLIEAILRLQAGQLGDFFPLLRILGWRKTEKARALRQRQVELLTSLIEQHKKLQKLGEITPGSYLETLLRIEGEGELEISNSDLVSLCSEFVVAGTDTTVNCMEWTMAHLVKEPQIQATLYDEIERVVGSRPVEEEDLGKMPYLQAVVKETLRLHPPGHFTLPHAVTEPCKLAGYDIPTNAVVNFHLASISRDAEIWEEPMEYRPERFLSREVDITGTKQVTMIPFGAGRRVCPGLGLALMHVELFISRLVQEYKWRTSKPGVIVDLSEKRVFTTVMKNPLKASIIRRHHVRD